MVFRLTQTHFLPKEIVSQGIGRNNITLTNYTCVCILHVSIYCPIQLLSHLSIPDEKFYYMQAKSKVNYIGMLNDGQCQILPIYIYMSDSVEL